MLQLATALLGIILATPARVEFPTKQDCARDYLPEDLLEKLRGANGAHVAECGIDDAAWLEYDLGGPEGAERIVATYKDGIGVFGANQALYGRFIDEKLRCGGSAELVTLQIVTLPTAPPAVLFVVRDDKAKGKGSIDDAKLIIFDGLKVRVAWEKKFKMGQVFDGSTLKWDRKAKKFK